MSLFVCGSKCRDVECSSRFPQNTLAIPFFVTCSFILVQSVHALVTFTKQLLNRSISGESGLHETLPRPYPFLKSRVEYHGGRLIFAYAVVRLLGCLVLLGVSLAIVVDCPDVRQNAVYMSPTRLLSICPELYMSITYVSLISSIDRFRSKNASISVPILLNLGCCISDDHEMD